MSLSSLYTGISGLDTYGRAMWIIGNNIANVNTVGYKVSRISFEDILSQSLVGTSGRFQVGRGVQVGSIDRLFNQGSFQTTDSVTDLAIDGDGFFVVASEGMTFYTRAGHFIMNEDGQLVNTKGYVLQGWMVDKDGSITSSLGDINLSTISSAPKATENITVHVNLDSNATEPPTWDVTDPINTSNFSTSINVYDSLGNSHMITIYFRQTSTDNQWEWYATVDGGEVQGGTAGTPFEIASGTLTFDTDGKLKTESSPSTFTVNFVGASSQDITFDFGESIDEGGTGLDGSTQFAGTSATNFLSEDGYSQGNLVSIQIDNDGIISGLFSNGQSRKVYKIALARFTSPWGLMSMGGNMFAETSQSGPPIVGEAGESGLGKINSNSLELSNVDLATEFVEMIKTQQAFQANSRVITTTDQMLQELVNLKR